jgi:hypothetical protein
LSHFSHFSLRLISPFNTPVAKVNCHNCPMLVEFIIWNNYLVKELQWDSPSPKEKKKVIEKISKKISIITEFIGPDLSSVIAKFLI